MQRMIEILNGIHETVNYGSAALGFRRYYNNEYENYGDHWHTSVEIIVPVCNGYTVIVGEEQRELQVDDIAIINSGIIHSLVAPPEGERIILQFDAALLYNLSGMETLLFDLKPLIYMPHSDDPVYQRVYSKLAGIVQEYDRSAPYRESLIYAYLMEAFVEIGRSGRYCSRSAQRIPYAKKQAYMEAMMKATTYINNRYTEKLTLEEVAAVSGFSKYHFTRIFKEFMNMTYYDYLNSRRVKRAEELLYKQEMSITDVAMNSGFSSLSAFNRTFKALKNCAPSDYRKRRENEEAAQR